MSTDAVQLKSNALAFVNAPIYPDPNSLPVPSALFQQVVYKPLERKPKGPPKNYQILTPKEMYKITKEKTDQSMLKAE
jgi:hypothetical protein